MRSPLLSLGKCGSKYTVVHRQALNFHRMKASPGWHMLVLLVRPIQALNAIGSCRHNVDGMVARLTNDLDSLAARLLEAPNIRWLPSSLGIYR